MKADQSMDNAEVTPSKKLKQARLPFKVISDVSPKPTTPQPRKRKLSTADSDSTPKIGRLSKENDAIEDAVVISDDDSKDASKDQNSEKSLNPYAKMVDAARKKKQQKGKKKVTTKKLPKQTKQSSLDSTEDNTGKNKEQDVEMMDVDVHDEACIDDSKIIDKCPLNKCDEETVDANVPESSPKKTTRSSTKGIANNINVNNASQTKTKLMSPSKEKLSPNSKPIKKPTRSSSRISNTADEVIVLEDSNNSSDVKSLSQKKEKSVSPKKLEKDLKQVETISTEDTPSKSNSEEAQLVTPKRSTRRKVKGDAVNDLNTSTISSKLDKSTSSTPTTPKLSRSLSVTNSLDDSMKESTVTDKLTPKQVQKKLESAKKREEREKERLEREKKRQQEKEEKSKHRQEKEELRKKERDEKEEAKRKEKEQREDLKRKEKEEKDKQKELEKKMKEEKEEQKKKEREEKEEQRKKEKEARDEERRKKQETLELEKQEQELKKKKAAKAFVNFFVPKQKSENSIENQCSVGYTPVNKSSNLSTFAIKSDMRLAPLVRVNLTEENKKSFDNLMHEQNLSKEELYLQSLKKGCSSGKTWPLSEKDDEDDVMIVEDELPLMDTAGEVNTCEPAAHENLRPKLFSFHENRRPPYWGTWRKKSAFVKPRTPFGREKILDYEVDSDEDWESDQEGESIEGSAAGSDDEQGPDEYELDNQVFVPHGYLSDEEGTMDGDDILSLSPETQKARLKHLEDEFETELKKPTEKLKPRMYGILWEAESGGKPAHCADALWNYFNKLSMILDDVTPLLKPAPVVEDTEKKVKKKKQVTAVEGDQQSPKTEKKKREKPEKKEPKKTKTDKKNTPDVKKNQMGINSFLKKINS